MGVRAVIPHRYPFLLVDGVDIMEENKRAVGTKCVTINENFFNGHFPSQPIMPGVLIIEALAQTACVMLMSSGGFENKIAFFLGIESAKFRSPVLPGNVLKLEVEVIKLGGRAGKFKGTARIDGKVATEAQMSFVLTDKKGE
ncbi:MAG: 3-hydroxyacyl-[acyl-carrier-protein] dehydratase FabZ [Elusimicrobia bacterium CG1_02_63_36]|nr:MAG: 3-hydroxyacyl-[acyl-carrier-protein] dehydratase FabZ [Elusimicrobia bacterium CG1_02_63_36]PIP82762.1 MAG: 3-hydroxyacyl-[acyl-carrier-protein] dehydratase FabZ [Elusimicrobia bacterium CG22_combo_CG10-13_8_21_14_all_63_91]PJA11988.1 MAG: 3-hydroxyacyl-[acyl-carrier-protein] dehydratase FabZ [Elusimicrobia bacterium CG_4_10_14_0_2_um_filter_63_34]PJB23834.1 MAG: 3-hydroxyacyl-[acyl-carrier-protein] dehydratase FabZ [Elusimicrobia bacterium CG_4_9_14_3_um_filter_62_55]